MDLAKDLLSISFPPVSPRIEIPLGEVLLDISNQLSHTGEASFANAILCDVSEESLHKVEPRTACGGEVYLETTVSCQPFLYVFLLVGAVVVDDEVDVHIIGRLSVDLLEEPEPLDVGMALFGVGVMLGPILGPSLGGWLLDVADWRWVFLINLPIGLVAMAGISVSVPRHDTEGPPRKFDWLGFCFLGVSIGSLQLLLDRGNSLNWFESLEIQLEGLAAALFFYLFLAQTFLNDKPFVDLRLFRDWNFNISMLLSFTIGFNMMATMAILPPFMQNLLNYPVLTTGMLLAPRGIGTMITMFLVGRLLLIIDARVLILTGLIVNALALGIMSTFDHNVTPTMLAWTGVIQGAGMGLMFVPMSSIAFSTLAPELRNDGTALYSMGRNLGSSVGISILMGMLAVYVREHRSHLVEHVSLYNPALHHIIPQLPVSSPASGLEMLNGMVQREAMMLGYLDDFRLMVAISVISVPLVLLLRPPGRTGAG